MLSGMACGLTDVKLTCDVLVGPGHLYSGHLYTDVQNSDPRAPTSLQRADLVCIFVDKVPTPQTELAG